MRFQKPKITRTVMTKADRQLFYDLYQLKSYRAEQMMEIFQISLRSYKRYIYQIEVTKNFFTPLKRGRPTVITEPIANFINRSLVQKSKQNINDLQRKIKQNFEVQVSHTAVWSYMTQQQRQVLDKFVIEIMPKSQLIW
ncbi:Hypothetical_protein [Hexamita inflata]|uniref:Hypothetical_protein n=1 Tax=Hexamita inflata TaxID=28002 RepID=A0AA86NFZ3_9EUKA|nr:Hypothetical protein HINF_LOCUS6200 [Hexamita inflata]CAI9918576.1 Hypothetical protein HINF_LOCUS6221 [Hexamita inflata]